MKSHVVLILFITATLPAAPCPADDYPPGLESEGVTPLVFTSGEWTWVKGLKRSGQMFEYFEMRGQFVKTETYVAVPATIVDIDASRDVNVALAQLAAACAEGNARDLQLDISGTARRVFDEIGPRAAFPDGQGGLLEGCYAKMEKGVRARRAQEGPSETAPAPTQRPRPTPTPWPTPTAAQIKAAQEAYRKSQPEPAPAHGAGSAISTDKSMFCSLLRLQDTQTVGDDEAYTIIAKRYGVTERDLRTVVISTIKRLNASGDPSLDKYCGLK